MNLKQVTAMLLAVTMLTAGAVGAVAATPGNGNAPDDAGSQADDYEQDDDEAAENESDAGDEEMNGSPAPDRAGGPPAAADRGDENAPAPADSAGERGPPTDMPEQVPAHVEEIHSNINSYLDGDIDDLGGALADVTPGDEDAEEESEDADAENEADDAEDDDMTATATA